MTNRVKVCGIYDLPTLEIALNHGVRDFIFDLRPKSFNFIQEYVLVQLLERISLRDKRIGLFFENESAVVMEKILTDVRNVMAQVGQLYCVFSSSVDQTILDKFNLGFYQVIHQIDSDTEILTRDKRCRGVILPQSIHLNYDLIKVLKFIGSVKNRDTSKEIILENFEKLNEVQNIPVDCELLSIGPSVETQYRVIDPTKLNNILGNVVSK